MWASQIFDAVGNASQPAIYNAIDRKTLRSLGMLFAVDCRVRAKTEKRRVLSILIMGGRGEGAHPRARWLPGGSLGRSRPGSHDRGSPPFATA